jgi:zinc protease
MAWLSPPIFTPGDAELDMLADVLAGGKTSRLYKRLVYELQIAQDVFAMQQSQELSSQFILVTTARRGHDLDELEQVIHEEIDRLKTESPTSRELERSVNQTVASVLSRLERVGGFGGKADLLNNYFVRTGNPDYFNEDLARYRALDPKDISAVAQTILGEGRVVLSIVPEGKTELAASAGPSKSE